MNPDYKRLLELCEENNKILHGMRRKQRFASLFSLVKWLFIIGIGYWSFLWLDPYLAQLMKMYQDINTLKNQASTITTKVDTSGLDNILKQLENLNPKSQ